MYFPRNHFNHLFGFFIYVNPFWELKYQKSLISTSVFLHSRSFDLLFSRRSFNHRCGFCIYVFAFSTRKNFIGLVHRSHLFKFFFFGFNYFIGLTTFYLFFNIAGGLLFFISEALLSFVVFIIMHNSQFVK